MILSDHYIALLFFLLGIIANQYMVVRMSHNQMRLQDIDRTLAVTTNVIQSNLGMMPNCTITIDPHLLQKSLVKNQTNMITFFILLNIVWMLFIILLLKPITITTVLGILVAYPVSVLLVSFLNYYILMVYFADNTNHYLFTDFFYPSLI